MVSPGSLLPTDSYVPILKAKRAEYQALKSCKPDRLVPLLEVVNAAAARTAIPDMWPRKDHALWIHPLNADNVDDPSFATDIASLFAELRPTTAAVPVVTVAEGPDTLAVVRHIVKLDGYGVVLRVEAEDILDAASNISAEIQATLDKLSITHKNTDFVLDCGLEKGSASALAAIANQCLQTLPSLADWRSVVVAFSAFPANMASLVPASSIRTIPREDATAFALTQPRFDRELVFGDYTIGVPTYSDVAFAPIPNIRYASGSDWIVHRAKERKAPSHQYRGLAQDIVSAPYYSGPNFSPGDKRISEVANGASGPGNATTHLQAGISRHIHVVLDRLATLGGP